MWPRQALGHREQSLPRLEWARSNEEAQITIALDCNQEGFLASCTESSSTGTEKFPLWKARGKAVLLIFSWSYPASCRTNSGSPSGPEAPAPLLPTAARARASSSHSPHSSSRARSRKYASSNSRVRQLAPALVLSYAEG